jgi:hyperosmotically inducible protein
MNSLKTNLKAWIVAVSLALGALFVVAPLGVASTQPAMHQGQSDSAARLTEEVRHELAMLPYYGVFDYLEYQITGTEVKLMGAVVNPSTKSQAEGSVKRINGVTRVVDDIIVLPPSGMDDQIRRAEYRAIFSAGQLAPYSMGANPAIHIIVDNGHVTLVGIVMNEADRNLAYLRANSVPGVFSVTNALRAD